MSFIQEDISWTLEDKSIGTIRKIGNIIVFESETKIFDSADGPALDDEVIRVKKVEVDLGGLSKRDFVLKHYNAGKTAKEIAAMGLNLGSVQTYIAKRPK